MKLYNILGLIIVIALTFVCYFATSNIFVGIGVLVLSVTFYFVLLYKKLNAHNSNTRKIHECYLFINNFLITLSIKGSLNAAFDATRTSISDDYNEYIASIEEMNPQEKLLYLNRYFPYHIFQIFIDIVFLWQEEGGDILSMSSHLLEEGRKSEEYLRNCHDLHLTRTIEFVVLWVFALAIIVVMRVSLNQFFKHIVGSVIFQVGLIVFFLFFLVSIDILVRKVTSKEMKGWDEYE